MVLSLATISSFYGSLPDSIREQLGSVSKYYEDFMAYAESIQVSDPELNGEEKKLGTENKETEEETEKQKKKQRKKTEEEEYKKQRKQKPRASLGEHRSRLNQVITWSKRDTHWKEGSSTPPSSS
ncbi:hypothetical protein PIB30_092494, partial [Stylosanthes scabra]|nr:hypothetical protein [Stylosanthes scabra]